MVDLDTLFDAAIPEPNTGCWIWTRGCSGDGYGRLRVNGADVSTHRLAWSLANGAIPAGAHVLHNCDMPLCVNPAHLRLGSHAENMADKAQRQRGRWSQLSDDQIERAVRMRAKKMPAWQVAAVLGVSDKTLERALARHNARLRPLPPMGTESGGR